MHEHGLRPMEKWGWEEGNCLGSAIFCDGPGSSEPGAVPHARSQDLTLPQFRLGGALVGRLGSGAQIPSCRKNYCASSLFYLLFRKKKLGD